MREYLKDIEEQRIPELRAQLVPLESGEMHLGERKEYGPWVDTTQRDIDRLKKSIVEYERIAADLRKSESL
ncbi:MAG: hypothetical protein ABR878_01605 [Roseiarcus sp.]